MPEPPAGLPSNPRRILVRGVNWLGDAVMTTPALQRLRERFPAAHISILTHRKLADVWLHHPSIDTIISFDSDCDVWSIGSELRLGLALRLFSSFLRDGSSMPQLTRVEVARDACKEAIDAVINRSQGCECEPFDLAVVLPNSHRAALEMCIARIPHRIGSARPWRDWFLTYSVYSRSAHVEMRKLSIGEVKRRILRTSGVSHDVPAGAHQIHHYLHLVSALGANPEPVAPRLEILPEEVRAAQAALLHQLQAATNPIAFLGLNPSAEYGPAKRWPAEKFSAVAIEVSKKLNNCVWLVFGGPGDLPICEQVAQAIGPSARNLAGKTSLRQLMAFLKLCRILLTNDTGPMHVAAALGTPVVVPFGSTSLELTGPGLPGDSRHRLLKSDAPCSPCFRRTCPIDFRCMNGISVERVVRAILQAANLQP